MGKIDMYVHLYNKNFVHCIIVEFEDRYVCQHTTFDDTFASLTKVLPQYVI